MIRTTILSFCLIFCVPAVQAQDFMKLDKSDLQALSNRMSGEFSSEQQSKDDSSFFHITLKMTPIWPDRKDGYWLYIEQAMASAQDKPYRQRIYHLFQQDEWTLVSKVFEIPSPAKYIGSADAPAKLAGLTVDSLIDRKGCAIFLHKNKEGNYTGSTPGKECLSNLRGATYATSEVVIQPEQMISWDRGWNSSGKQVWGAVKGGYQFVRVHKD